MEANVVWQGYQEVGARFPMFLRAPNDVVLLVDESTEILDPPPTRLIRVNDQLIPWYLSIVAADAQDNLFLFLDGHLRRFEWATRDIKEFAYTAPSYDYDFEFAPADNGMLLGACELFFSAVAQDGTVFRNCRFGACNLDDFEVAPGPEEPFWSFPLSMPSSIDTFGETFVIGGSPVNRLYRYTFGGKLLLVLDEANSGGASFRFDQEVLAVVRFDAEGQIWASTTQRLYVFTSQGDLVRFWNWNEIRLWGEPVDGWFGIGRNGLHYVYGLPHEGKFALAAVELLP